ncbi:MAG: maturase [Ignavibacteriota bacterium]|nr:MAG: maturase [Ignavibacteriota bacterium]
MNRYLEKTYLNALYDFLLPKLKTGKDKVTKTKFNLSKEYEFDVIIRKCNNSTYKFTPFKILTATNGRKVYIPTIRDRIVIEILKQSISKKFRVRFTDRKNIIKVLKTKLESNQEYFVLKFDIKKFFNSIPQNLLLQKIKRSSILSLQEYHLLKELLKNTPEKGLPVGISLSSILSEIYLEDFDRIMKRIDQRIGCYFRYVDDIIILFNSNLRESEINNIEANIISYLKTIGLKINKTKLEKVFIPAEPSNIKKFSYLGYDFIRHERDNKMQISDAKLKKIHSKIDFCLNDFKKFANMDLLDERLCFLTRKNTMLRYHYRLRNNNIEKGRPNLVTYGVIENYKYAHIDQFIELDKYLRGKLHSTFGRFVKKELLKHSFTNSLQRNKINLYHMFTNDDYITRILKLDNDRNHNQLRLFNRQLLEFEYRKILLL